jgi:aspartate/methionine/tyrosine aminotransferase
MKYCFDADTTLPFLAFRGLRSIAEKAVGEANILDLSQGEPGYGFAPNTSSRRFLCFLMMLDIAFNDNEKELHFANKKPSDLSEIEATVKSVAFENFPEELARTFIQNFEQFILELEKVCESQNLRYDRFGIYYELFKYSNLAGGRYPQPSGHPLLQAVMAEEYSIDLGKKVYAHEIISISGASHGIGATFKALGKEGIGFLKEGDTVAMTSPVYAPYNAIFEERNISVLSLFVNPITGEIDEKNVAELKNSPDRIKVFVLIDPNNPTGFPANKKLLTVIEEIAEAHNAIIVTDEVYFRFFENKTSIASLPLARKRTIRIDSLSKIQRATGLRVGDVYVSDEANEFISREILGGIIPSKYKDIRHLLFLAKSPGGANIGLFQHITGIPGVSVALALSHILLGKVETDNYVKALREKVSLFYNTLQIPHPGNGYYGIINLADIESSESAILPIEEKLERIAERGVVVMPANLFFSESDRARVSYRNYIRVSLPNLSFSDTKRAAQIIKEVLS